MARQFPRFTKWLCFPGGWNHESALPGPASHGSLYYRPVFRPKPPRLFQRPRLEYHISEVQRAK